MTDLTNIKNFQKLDPKDVFGSTGMLADQCEQIWQETRKLSFPKDYASVNHVILSGMGGSAFGGHIIQSLYKDELKTSFFVNNDYILPRYANAKTLVILASYSGTTEETISSANDAKKKRAKITAITTGGQLKAFLKENNYPGVVFQPLYNPSGQPRLAPGYMAIGVMAILQKTGLLTVSDEEVLKAIQDLRNTNVVIQKQARDLAEKIAGFIPAIFSAEFLNGNAHILRNQFNETAKSFSAFEDLPELNHHLMEGLKNPKDKKLATLFIASDFYSENLKKRLVLTMDVVKKNGIQALEYQVKGKTKLSQVLNVLSFGGYLTFYLAMIYKQDPSLIPWVDYFKEKLKKPEE